MSNNIAGVRVSDMTRENADVHDSVAVVAVVVAVVAAVVNKNDDVTGVLIPDTNESFEHVAASSGNLMQY